MVKAWPRPTPGPRLYGENVLAVLGELGIGGKGDEYLILPLEAKALHEEKALPKAKALPRASPGPG